MLKDDVIKYLLNESAFSQDLLGPPPTDFETKCIEAQLQLEMAQLAIDKSQAVPEHWVA